MVGAGGMETWGGRRSAAYASMCGPLLPFLREGNPPATCQNSDNLEVVDTKKELAKIAGVSHDTIARVEKIVQKAPEEVKENQGVRTDISQNSVKSVDTQKELAKIAGVSHDTIARVHGSGRCTLPFRGGNIEGRPAGGGPGFSGTAGTCRATVRDPGALRGRLGAGVVAYVPRYGAYVTLSRAPRETALFPVHCRHSSLPGRYASAAYTPVCGGTTGNMPRIPGGRGCFGMRRYASVWFTCEVRVLARNVTVRRA